MLKIFVPLPPALGQKDIGLESKTAPVKRLYGVKTQIHEKAECKHRKLCPRGSPLEHSPSQKCVWAQPLRNTEAAVVKVHEDGYLNIVLVNSSHKVLAFVGIHNATIVGS